MEIDSSTPMPIIKSYNIYNYTGINRRIENYSSNEKVQLSSDFTGINIDGNNFIIKSSTGALTLENVHDNIIDVAGSDGNTATYVYMASGEGDVDGSDLNVFEVITASEGNNNQLIAGNGGSSLIGGKGNNTLAGVTVKTHFITRQATTYSKIISQAKF